MMPVKNRWQCLHCKHLFFVSELKVAFKMTKCPKCGSRMTMKAEGCVIAGRGESNSIEEDGNEYF